MPTTEEKPEVPFSRLLREIRDPFWESLLRGFASDIGHLAVQNRVPAELQIGQKTCVVVVVCSFFLAAPFSSRSMDVRPTFQKKDAKKRGLAPISVGEAVHFCLRPG